MFGEHTRHLRDDLCDGDHPLWFYVTQVVTTTRHYDLCTRLWRCVWCVISVYGECDQCVGGVCVISVCGKCDQCVCGECDKCMV